ncbi:MULTISPECIES: ChaN family lipoprotein [unclassified Coleofasciculus]|uniref:ChaN family lipoprotein n=1 Tax=unclassified Coleofasciculus TaxID=2692782 RepID=UPI00188195F4|nr:MULTISPECIES: ChaN family lipoprotein [unclassified Coleofasciculus]MBE9128977.1 ChaN family lipoprotein [Coleofasciculus sp. LEGE 07081]MBE9148975.1 ChaN family lipoprotein [Coleofasciculus sp. LEGE 07092]
MKICKITKLCGWSLGIVFFCTTPACAQNHQLQTEPVETPSIESRETIVQELLKADIVYLGETHDSPEDHNAQLEILQALYQQNPKIAIAMEMFQRPYQDILDRYLAGQITEAQLIQQTEYEQRWGFPWEYYAPLLRFAKTHQLPVLALNTPTEVTRKVARTGLESLTPTEQQHIPPRSEIRTDNAEYRQMIREIYEQHHPKGQGNSTNFERFFTAQVLWDETMAAGIADFVKANPDYQVMVIVGKGHIVYGYGIPSRVARRLNTPELVQRSVLFGVPEAVQPDGEKAIADFFW